MLKLNNINKYYNTGTVNEMCLFQDFNLSIEESSYEGRFPWPGSGRHGRFAAGVYTQACGWIYL